MNKHNLKPFGDHPINKYLLVEYKEKIIIAKQTDGNDYFETVLGRKLREEDMDGWLGVASDEDIEANMALLGFIYAMQSNNDDETIH